MVIAVILIIFSLLLGALSFFATRQHQQENRRRVRRGKAEKNLSKSIYGLYGGAAGAFVLGVLIFVIAILPGFSPKNTENSDPANWDISWEIFEGDVLMEEYKRNDKISFGDPEEYFALPGVAAFRGNNYRNSATYGTASVSNQTIERTWTAESGELTGTKWAGSGWTGQPLVVQWDAETREIMNLYDDKKTKDGLVEVIYATLDGNIYFLDLEDGTYTRDPIKVGMCFKGAGSLDPRGYPLMYVGSGDVNAKKERPRMFIISLIDGKILYEYGHDETLSFRTDNESWCAFDSSPLVHADSDTLIWPGENGLLYSIVLNTDYSPKKGEITISPEKPVLTRYNTSRSGGKKYWYGFEAGVNIVENYLYVSENGGMFYCVDLNTMELIWAQDTKDDSNSTPVFERVDDREGYLYTAPSLHWTKDENDHGTISIYKLDALTGEIIWEHPYECYTVEGVSGGVQSSPLLGRAGESIEGMVIYSISRSPGLENGLLVALDTETGEEIWRLDLAYYAWSSPVGIYTEDGTAYVVLCGSAGHAFLIDGATGEILDQTFLEGLVEASPVVYENKLVVGTRDKLICGMQVN